MPDTGEIVASILTGNDVGDAGRVPDLLGQIEGEITSVMADGAYEGAPTYQAIANRQPEQPPAVILPPRSSAVPGDQADRAPTQRDQHTRLIVSRHRCTNVMPIHRYDPADPLFAHVAVKLEITAGNAPGIRAAHAHAVSPVDTFREVARSVTPTRPQTAHRP